MEYMSGRHSQRLPCAKFVPVALWNETASLIAHSRTEFIRSTLELSSSFLNLWLRLALIGHGTMSYYHGLERRAKAVILGAGDRNPPFDASHCACYPRHIQLVFPSFTPSLRRKGRREAPSVSLRFALSDTSPVLNFIHIRIHHLHQTLLGFFHLTRKV